MSDIIAGIQGRLGIITLDRPKALNALSLPMVDNLNTVLADWRENPAVDAVLIRGAGRGFCGGGDVRAIGGLPDPAAREQLGREFFRAEYQVIARIHTFPKPFIALAHGIVMGGGMGLSVHGDVRIVNETTVMAMPETVLGLFPDVGATWFLDRCPGRIGMYLGLTGARLSAADALWSGLATHHLPAECFEPFVNALATRPSLDRDIVETVIAGFSTAPAPGALAARAPAIDRIFAAATLDEAIAALSAAPAGGWEAETLATLQRASPTSLRATWRRLCAAAGQTIETVLDDDYRMAVRFVAGHDFAEGVRAILIDKDNAPHWKPAALSAVSEAAVDALLEPLPPP